MTATVAIVGRPNVGKSTLFNRLVGRRQSIVHDQPGVTRDRIVGQIQLDNEESVYVIDTGGLAFDEDLLGLNEQVFLAVEECDLLVLVVDGREGLVPADIEVWEALRGRGKPALLAVNKGDTKAAQQNLGEFYALGISSVLLVSAEHGEGIGDLVEAIDAAVPEAGDIETPDAPPVAIVGRPNVGKSSLVNKLAGEPRVLVSPVAGTTRDPIDSLLEYEGKQYLLVDTAGIRRRAKTSGAAEDLAIMMARRQIDRARIVVLVIDASEGVTSGDLGIAGAAWDMGRSLIVVCNKWDLLDDDAREHLELTWERMATLYADPPRVNLSAETGRGVTKLFPALNQALEGLDIKVGTGEINRIFEKAVAFHQTPGKGGKPWRLYYSTQVSTSPPTFMLFANQTLPRNDPYRRYLENRLREALILPGVPIRLVIRKRDA
ncbi:MAG: ribosome biogenesis GTPase Der [Thermoanaerobaculia bacterium]|nr:ribosome biogenesis GTPase Der [Thermoanaerobaculia bacterium]